MTKEEIDNLSNYRGMTPIPEDFDEFWVQRIQEADAAPLEFTVSSSEVPAFPGCEYFNLCFRGMGGARLYAKYVKPVSDKKLPLVLQFHGYPGSARSWLEQSSFAGMGLALIALECPGQGGPGDDLGGYLGTTVAGHIVAGLDGPTENMYYVRLYQNIRILCRIIQALPGIDVSQIYVNGGSQGGAQGIACCALNPEFINRAAICYPFLSDFRLVWELDADEIAYEGIRYYSRWFDPDGSRTDQWFQKLGYIDTMNFAHMVKCPVLFGTGLADTVCPPQAQCAVYNRLNCPKKRYLFPGYGHEEIQSFDDMLLDYFGKEEAQL